MKAMLFLVSSLVVSAGLAHADTPPAPVGFDIEVAHLQLDMHCTLSTDEGGTQECDMNVKSRGRQVIALNPSSDSAGFLGVDSTTDSSGMGILMVSADENQNLTNVALMHVTDLTHGNGMRASLSTVETNALSVFNIPRMMIAVGQDGQSMTLDVSVNAYSPAKASNIITTFTKQSMTDYVLAKVKPVIDAARLKAKQ